MRSFIPTRDVITASVLEMIIDGTVYYQAKLEDAYAPPEYWLGVITRDRDSAVSELRERLHEIYQC